MTPEQIDQLAAGPRLDSLIAEKLMNWLPKNREETWALIPCYSTDIAAAWLVVEKLKALNQRLGLSQGIVDQDEEWVFTFTDWTTTKRSEPVYAETAPLAICRAALKTVIGDKE